MFASKREAQWAAQLDWLRFAKDPRQKVIHVDYQYRMPIVVNGIKICEYVADFRVRYADGREEIQDAKGFRTEVYKLKKKMVNAVYGYEIIEV